MPHSNVLYGQLKKWSLKPPQITKSLLDSAQVVSWVRSRLSEIIIAGTKANVVIIDRLLVECSSTLITLCKDIDKVDGIKVVFKQSRNLDADVFSFRVYIDSEEYQEESRYLPIPGICFKTPITAVLFETVWTLHIIDGMSLQDAKSAAHILNGVVSKN